MKSITEIARKDITNFVENEIGYKNKEWNEFEGARS